MKILAHDANPKAKVRMFNVHVSFPPDVHARLVELANEEGRPLANLVRRLVIMGLKSLDE